MRIGELAEKTGLSRDTIRFYERNGLVHSGAGKSNTNNYRDYTPENLRWLAFVTQAREAGMSVADLKDIFDATAGTCDLSAGRAIIAQKIAELRDRKQQIDRAITFLEGALSRTE